MDLSKLLLTRLQADVDQKVTNIWIGCSGGIDSMVLTDLLRNNLKKRYTLGLVHINYGFRGAESDGDEKFVRDYAKEYDIELHAIQVTEAQRRSRTGESLQDWARNIRLNLFQELSSPTAIVALGHHGDDHVETIIQRLARGTGGRGLVGLRHFSKGLWRPLLSASRQQIRDWADRQNVLYREDSSNAKLLYSRNRIRHNVTKELEHLYPHFGPRLTRMANEIDEVYTFLHQEVLSKKTREEKLSGPWLRSLTRGVAVEALSQYLSFHTKNEQPTGWQDGDWMSFPRSFLHEVVDRLEDETVRNARWSRKLPHFGLLIVDRDEVSYLRAEYIAFGPRWSQHRGALNAWHCEYLLPGNTQVHCELGQSPGDTILMKNDSSQQRKIDIQSVCGKEWERLVDGIPKLRKNTFDGKGYVIKIESQICYLISDQYVKQYGTNLSVQCQKVESQFRTSKLAPQ